MVGTKTNGWETKTKKTKTSKMYFSAAQSIFTQLQSCENWQSCTACVALCVCVVGGSNVQPKTKLENHFVLKFSLDYFSQLHCLFVAYVAFIWLFAYSFFASHFFRLFHLFSCLFVALAWLLFIELVLT